MEEATKLSKIRSLIKIGMENGIFVLDAEYPEGELGQIKMWEHMIMDAGMRLPT